MRQKLNGITSLALMGIVAVAVFMGCATANNTVTVGIVHDKLDSRAGGATGTTDLLGIAWAQRPPCSSKEPTWTQ